MRFNPLLLTSVFFWAGGCPVKGMFMFEETQKVPIARLLTNLEAKLARNTNDFEVTYQLARLHSMTYATTLAEMDVTKKGGDPVFGFPGTDSGVPRAIQVFKSPQQRHTALKELTNAIVLYERALALLRKSTNSTTRRWMILPTQLGLAWCLDQSGQREKALMAYWRTLDIAWRQEVTGDFDLKEWVAGAWDDVRAGRNPIHGPRRGYIGPGVCYSEEVIGYLLKLLDPKKDAVEIAQLNERSKILLRMGRAITPLLIPLAADSGLDQLVNPHAGVAFDLDGSGRLRRWGWITPRAAWLVFDADGSGRITSALQLFGNVSFWVFWRDGYAALASLDDNGDEVLSGHELNGLALWCDANANGMSESGEVRPVGEHGITQIACQGESYSEDAQWNPKGVTFRDGAMRPSYDWISLTAGNTP